MRKSTLFFSDVRFQLKYGFYFIYTVLTLVYIGVLSALPASWRSTAAVLMVFSDPAAMGLFFMGAIVLFEKSERVLDSLAVSPVKPFEYTLSKLCSLGLIASLVAFAVGFGAGIVKNIPLFLVSVFLCSCLFSSAGLIIAAKISTLNGFIIASVLPELLINVPAFAWVIGFKKSWLLIHPGVAAVELISGVTHPGVSLLVLALWSALFFLWSVSSVEKMLKTVGGAKL